MIALTCIENYVNKENLCYGLFLIEPLDVGQAITLGNALRRALLSDLIGYGITGVRINNIKHEFASVKGLREDLLEIILNLKEIIFQASFSTKCLSFKGFLNVKGPLVITAGLLKLPKKKLRIINPNQYICTLLEKSEFYLEIDIEAGNGYLLAEERNKPNISQPFSSIRPSTLFVDGLFMPIRNVNYKIRLIHDTYGNIKESLIFEIITNGSISPKRSLQEALKALLNLFLPLFSIPELNSLRKNFLSPTKKKRKSKKRKSKEKKKSKKSDKLKFFVKKLKKCSLEKLIQFTLQAKFEKLHSTLRQKINKPKLKALLKLAFKRKKEWLETISGEKKNLKLKCFIFKILTQLEKFPKIFSIK